MTLISAKQTSDVENFIFHRMATSGILGLSIAMINKGELFYQKGFGFRDFVKGTSATPKTTYCIGSVTKSFTALAVMQLMEKGLLSPDDPVEKYLPIKARALGEPICIKHLLSHSSGLAALGYAEATLSAVTDTADVWLPISSPEDLLIFMAGADEWAHSKPGERYAYLNEGYILLGAIIEKASGQDYADYVKKNILEPLGMTRSTFREDDVVKDDDVATPYITSEGDEKTPTRYPYGQMISDGGLMSNAQDMVRFLKMLVSDGEIDGKPILRPENVRKMMEPKIRTVEEPYDGKSYNYYGNGLRIKTNFFGHSLIHHSGAVFGSSAYMGLIPEERMGVVILANGGYFLEDVGEHAMALMLGEDPSDATYFKRLRTLDELTGTYRTFRNTSTYKITRSGGILELETSYWRRTFSTPLIPVNIEGDVKNFRVYGIESTTPIQFVRRNSDLYLIYERNMAKKVADL